jgi:hypothetical protein
MADVFQRHQGRLGVGVQRGATAWSSSHTREIHAEFDSDLPMVRLKLKLCRKGLGALLLEMTSVLAAIPPQSIQRGLCSFKRTSQTNMHL